MIKHWMGEETIKMERLCSRLGILIRSSHLLLFCCTIILSSHVTSQVFCNPLAFNTNAMPLIAVPQPAYPGYPGSPAAMMMAGQYDPYASFQAPYLMQAPAYGAPWAPIDIASRRALPGIFGRGERAGAGDRERNRHNDEPSDEQKALDGLPLSFVSILVQI